MSISSPSTSATPTTSAVVARAPARRGAPVRTVAPKRLAARRIASRHAAHAAAGKPHAEADLAVAATSPIEWCSSTYAVPGASGPAHVPMMPLTRHRALHGFGLEPLAQQVADAHIVNRRMTSELERTSRPLSRHTTLSWSSRSDGRFEPSSGRDLREQRAEHLGEYRPSTRPTASSAAASAFECRATASYRSVPVLVDQRGRAVELRVVRRAERLDLVAVAPRGRGPSMIASGMRLIT